jgi:hypothetical protein
MEHRLELHEFIVFVFVAIDIDNNPRRFGLTYGLLWL